MTINNRLTLLLLLLVSAYGMVGAPPSWAQKTGNKVFAAKDGAFTFSAPAAFKQIPDAPGSALVAIEVAGLGLSIMAEQGEPIKDLDTAKFAEGMKKKLAESGAKILGSARANLGAKPAVSFLVGGVKAGKESLFVFNLRDKKTYTFVMNYPEGSRKDAAELWQAIAPTFKFK